MKIFDVFFETNFDIYPRKEMKEMKIKTRLTDKNYQIQQFRRQNLIGKHTRDRSKVIALKRKIKFLSV